MHREGTTLVIGGAGRTGVHIVGALGQRGRAIRILSRHAAAAPPGVEVACGNIADAGSVKAAMDGIADVVIVVEAVPSDKGDDSPERVHFEGTRTVLAASAAEAHIVLVSQIYITRPERYPEAGDTIYWRGRAEEVVRAGGRAYTIVRPGWLTDEPGTRQAIRLEQGDTGEGYVSREDVAAVCVQSLITSAARGKTFEMDNRPGVPLQDWPAIFAALHADVPRGEREG